MRPANFEGRIRRNPVSRIQPFQWPGHTMQLLPPYDRGSNTVRIRALIVALVLSVLLLVAMRILDAPLRSPVAPRGIVSFELAKNMEASRQILASWNAQAKMHAALSLGLDYLFLIVYALFISLACVQVGKALQGHRSLLAALGGVLAWSQFFAAILDAVENLVLISLLLNFERLGYPAVARTCAIIKFIIVGAGLIYIAGGSFIIGLQKLIKER